MGWSILNRVGHPEDGDSLTAVLRDPKGFEIVPEGGSRRSAGSVLWERSGSPDKVNSLERRAWAKARRVANGILSGRIADPVEGGAVLLLFRYPVRRPMGDGQPRLVPQSREERRHHCGALQEPRAR
ncbi:MAG: hypothetical protein EOP66_00855 [Sphingomonas sp.]|nr:MAG: hypothetical protein EOP66_00855 [Sphingomonas sp.]